MEKNNQKPVLFPQSCHNKAPKSRWLKATEVCCLTFWTLELRNQSVAGLLPPESCEEKSAPHVSLSSFWFSIHLLRPLPMTALLYLAHGILPGSARTLNGILYSN